MVFELCEKCGSVCIITIIKNKIECLKCGNIKPLVDDYTIEDISYSTSNTSLFDNYKILGPFDPKVTLVEKKCPKCVNKNIHLARIILTGYTPVFKCKICNYTEYNN